MNSPFRVRLRARAPASASPRPGLPAVPVAPSFRLGVQKYIFFSNRQTFSEKFFEKFLSRGSRPLCLAPAKQDRKSTAFLQSAKLFSRKFLRNFSIR